MSDGMPAAGPAALGHQLKDPMHAECCPAPPTTSQGAACLTCKMVDLPLATASLVQMVL